MREIAIEIANRRPSAAAKRPFVRPALRCRAERGVGRRRQHIQEGVRRRADKAVPSAATVYLARCLIEGAFTGHIYGYFYTIHEARLAQGIKIPMAFGQALLSRAIRTARIAGAVQCISLIGVA